MSEVQFECVLTCGQGDHIEMRSRKSSTWSANPEGSLPQPTRRPSYFSAEAIHSDQRIHSGAFLQPPFSISGSDCQIPDQPVMAPSLFSPSFTFRGPSIESMDESLHRPPMLHPMFSVSNDQDARNSHIPGTLNQAEELHIVKSDSVLSIPEGRRASILPSLLDRASKEVTAKIQDTGKLARPLLAHHSTAPEGFMLQGLH